MAQTTAVDYKSLPNCGGFAMDRPDTYEKLREAFQARYEVVEQAMGEEFSCEWFHDWTRHWNEAQRTAARKYQESGRIMCFVCVGANEGYVVNICIAPRYFDQGSVIDFMTAKCWTRETVQALAASFNELILRMD